ncbi:MAG: hypothetical protein RL339_2648, partial [Pseudomonadota bacterium]
DAGAAAGSVAGNQRLAALGGLANPPR